MDDEALPLVYRTFILRCWQDGIAWRFSVAEVSAGERRQGFTSLEAVAAYVRDELGLAPGLPPSTDGAVSRNP